MGSLFHLNENIYFKNKLSGTSLVAQWLRIRLPVQGTRVRAHVAHLLKPARLEPVLRNKRSHRNEKPAHRNEQ